MKSAAGDARTPKPHAAETRADTQSDSATETKADLKEKETGFFKAFLKGKTEVGLKNARRSGRPTSTNIVQRRT
jgi:hypothetical protein